MNLLIYHGAKCGGLEGHAKYCKNRFVWRFDGWQVDSWLTNTVIINPLYSPNDLLPDDGGDAVVLTSVSLLWRQRLLTRTLARRLLDLCEGQIS